MAFPSPSNWRLRGSASSLLVRSLPVSTTACASQSAAAGRDRPNSKRCAPPSTGAMRCSLNTERAGIPAVGRLHWAGSPGRRRQAVQRETKRTRPPKRCSRSSRLVDKSLVMVDASEARSRGIGCWSRCGSTRSRHLTAARRGSSDAGRAMPRSTPAVGGAGDTGTARPEARPLAGAPRNGSRVTCVRLWAGRGRRGDDTALGLRLGDGARAVLGGARPSRRGAPLVGAAARGGEGAARTDAKRCGRSRARAASPIWTLRTRRR